jgi:nitrate/nitrite transport system ATP-binding protein
MRIISYQQLMELPPVFPYKRPRLAHNPVINLAGWKNELIAVIGGQQAGQAFLRNAQALDNPGLPSGPQTAVNLVPDLTIFGHIYRVIARDSPYLPEASRWALTEQYLTAAYLEPYRTKLPGEVKATVWNQLLLALAFAQEQQVMVLPDIFAEAPAPEKALLQRALQNLRHIQQKPRTIFYYARQPEEALLLADRLVVLEPGVAGTIGEVIPVFFYRPRHRRTLRQLPAYRALRQRLRYLLTDAFAGEDLVSFSPLESFS